MRVLAAFLFIPLTATSYAPAAARGASAEDASRFNGTWQMNAGPYSGEMKLWVVEPGTLRVEFAGSFSYGTAGGTKSDTDDAIGTAATEGQAAAFTPESAEGGCVITLRLQGRGWMQVEESGSCGFRGRVTAAGRYRRMDHLRPWFNQPTAHR
jgi:hypothetical protein